MLQTYFFVTGTASKTRVFAPDMFFNAYLVFLKTKAYLSGANYFQADDLTHKYYTSLKNLVMEKHSSLFGLFVSDKEKSFIASTSGANVIKLFFFEADDEAK
jgi:hypothetical protein